MGRDKARLPFRGGDLVSAVAAAVARAAGNVTLVGHPQLPAIPDRYPGQGPLGAILTALHHTSADWNAACLQMVTEPGPEGTAPGSGHRELASPFRLNAGRGLGRRPRGGRILVIVLGETFCANCVLN